MRQITKIGKKNVKVSRADWDLMWDRIKLSIAGAMERGGGCDQFCGIACEGHEGCDLSFGSKPECGALCNDGEVYLQDPV